MCPPACAASLVAEGQPVSEEDSGNGVISPASYKSLDLYRTWKHKQV